MRLIGGLLALGGFIVSVLLTANGCGKATPAVYEGKVGTFFFFWHDCQRNESPTLDYPFTYGPKEGCSQKQFIYHPQGMNRGRPQYSARNRLWYIDEIQQMKLAGVDYIFPVYWGDHPIFSFFNTENLKELVAAIDWIGSDLKIGLFDDTTSQVSQWNYDNGRDYAPYPAMNIADTTLWTYFYEDKVQPYFQTIPRRLWATHNGEPVEKGGRPIVITWIAESNDLNPDGPSFFSYHGAAASLWDHIKKRFVEDFGVEPFLILETTWYERAGDLGPVGDAQYAWGAAAFHSIWYDRNGYVVSSVGPGYDDHLVRAATPRRRPRNLVHDEKGVESSGNSTAFFRNEYLMNVPIPQWPHHGVRPDSNLVLIETWNELFEGTAIEKMLDWPDLVNRSETLAPETYIQTLRELKRTIPGYRDYDHTIVSTRSNGEGSWTLTIRNDGDVTWSPSVVRLGYQIRRSDSTLLAEGTLAELPHDVAFGESVALTFAQPPQWTDAASFPESGVLVQMKVGDKWFSELGDSYLIRAVHDPFPGFF